MSEAFRWDDISGSLDQMFTGCPGWSEQLVLMFEGIFESNSGNALPKIMSISRVATGLRIGLAGGSDFVTSVIRGHVDRIVHSCEICSISASKQLLPNGIRTVCSYCYNKLLKATDTTLVGVFFNSSQFDIAESFPDLVSPDTASFVPSIGKGWYMMLTRYLSEITHQIEVMGLSIGTIQISDVKLKRTVISVDFSSFHESINHIEDRLVFESSLTCVECGHFGERIQGPGKYECLCTHCYCERLRESK